MKSFRTFITEDKSYVEKIVKQYKIPSEFINYITEKELSLKLPDNIKSDNKIEPHPSLVKIMNDLKTGRLRPQRMMSYRILDYYRDNNEIIMSFANERVKNPPKKLYHWTKTENVENILKNGLNPSSSKDWNIGTGGTSEVTYNALFLVKSSSILSRSRGFKHFKKPKYQVIEITDTNELTLWKDPHYYDPDPFSVVSFEKIPPKHLSLKK